jgi:hypothetical protein
MTQGSRYGRFWGEPSRILLSAHLRMNVAQDVNDAEALTFQLKGEAFGIGTVSRLLSGP